MKISSISPIVLLAFTTVVSAKVVLDKVHAFNVQRICSKGLAGSTEAISLSNMRHSASHQVPETSIEFTEDTARVEMSSGGIVVVIRNRDVIVPDPVELGCLQTHLPQLAITKEFKAEEDDLVILIHPLNRKWSVKPVDLTGTFVHQDFDVELLRGFLKYSKKFWNVAIVAGIVSVSSEESKGSIVFVPAPKVKNKGNSIEFSPFILHSLMGSQTASRRNRDLTQSSGNDSRNSLSAVFEPLNNGESSSRED
jgi:hypothetical protein